MPSIGQFNFTGWRGRIRPANRNIDLFTAPTGIDGSVATLGGYRSDVAEIIATRDVASLALVTQAVNQYRALEGTAATVIDPFGITWSAVFVVRVITDYDQLITGGFRITSQWALLPQSTQPA